MRSANVKHNPRIVIAAGCANHFGIPNPSIIEVLQIIKTAQVSITQYWMLFSIHRFLEHFNVTDL